MSILHSFYCWGSAGVIVISTLFLKIFGVSSWKILAAIWALLPLANCFVFTKVPACAAGRRGGTGMHIGQLFRSRVFWVIMLMMLCAGASEQAVSQWASTFAEKGLGVSKAVGDLAGPTVFALLMATSRLLYSKFGAKIDLNKAMMASALLCVVSLSAHRPDQFARVGSCRRGAVRPCSRHILAGHVLHGGGLCAAAERRCLL